ncbi:MAG: pilin [Candidatus Paceibacterota bacterium]
MFKRFLTLGIVILTLSLGSFCFASIQLISPSSGAAGVPLNGSFQWQPVAGADRYVLRISSSFLLQDNVPTSACQSGVCNLYFTELQENARPEYGENYTWDVVAYNENSALLDSSPAYSFSTAQEPPPSCDNDGVCDAPEETSENCSDCGGGGGGQEEPIIAPLKAGSLWELINNLINFFFIFGIVLGPLLIIYAAIIMMTSAGDPDKLAKAKTIITWTVVALIIILLAKAIPAIVKGSFGG